MTSEHSRETVLTIDRLTVRQREPFLEFQKTVKINVSGNNSVLYIYMCVNKISVLFACVSGCCDGSMLQVGNNQQTDGMSYGPGRSRYLVAVDTGTLISTIMALIVVYCETSVWSCSY